MSVGINLAQRLLAKAALRFTEVNARAARGDTKSDEEHAYEVACSRAIMFAMNGTTEERWKHEQLKFEVERLELAERAKALRLKGHQI